MVGIHEQTQLRSNADQRRFSFALLAIAGWCDAAGLMLFANLFVSFMSGDATQFGVGFGSGRIGFAAEMLGAQIVFVFVVGAAAGRHLRLRSPENGRRHLLAINTILLAVVALVGQTALGVPGFVFAVFAMGLQNAMMHEAAGVPVGTMLTGTLVRLGEAITNRFHGRPALIGENLGQWIAFVIAAAAGTLGYRLLGAACFVVPALATAALIPFERRLPKPRNEPEADLA